MFVEQGLPFIIRNSSVDDWDVWRKLNWENLKSDYGGMPAKAVKLSPGNVFSSPDPKAPLNTLEGVDSRRSFRTEDLSIG
jgi:hypothetical protein